MTIATRFYRRRGQRRLCAIAAPSCCLGRRNCRARWLDCQCPAVPSAPLGLHSHRGRDGVISAIDVDAMRYSHHSASLPMTTGASRQAMSRATQQPWLGVKVAQRRFGSERERCVAGPQYHSSRCTELASCKDTRSSPGLCATGLLRYSPREVARLAQRFHLC